MDKFTAHLVVGPAIVNIESDTLEHLIVLVGRMRAGAAPLSTAVVTEVSPTTSPAIAPADNPETGVPQPPAPPLPTVASQVFGQVETPRATMTPEQQIAAHAAGTLPPPVINPAALVPGGAAAAVTPPAPPAPPQADVDSKGVRYDHRIHSAGKTFVADGSWRMKKGVDEALVAQVLAEQRGLAALPPAPAAPVAPVAPPAPVATVVPPVPPAPPAPAGAPSTFAEFCDWLNLPMLTSPPKLTIDEVNAAAQRHGLPMFNALSQRPDFIPAVHAELAALVASRN